ncbi:response regulator [Pelagicoccus enzymogenes]|uniref:response regulator n=1 Tax=Pelagicoccus enzymogenes TaxID=2773457 RepID=UPI00280E5613|nr:response regulator [Pelagicoccus enzymogenes]MDQ8200263.1 response regulator [Pelagicoccus enzymogenes]
MKTILIIDDSQTVRNYHKSIVKAGGFRVVTAVDGADGLEKLYLNTVDMVLTDINMQGIDGYEFTRRVRSDENFERLPIVMISTEGEESDKLKGFEAGANLYMVKPAEPEFILEQIRMFL